jgi:hypothetical protein
MSESLGQDNPFRAPQPAAAPDAGAPPSGAPQEWSPFEAFSFGWQALTGHPIAIVAFLVGFLIQLPLPLLGMVLQSAFGLSGSRELEPLALGISAATSLLNIPLAAWMALGQMRIVLDLCRGKRPGLGRLFETSRYGSALLGVLILQFGGAFAAFLGALVFAGPGLAALALTDGGAISWVLLVPGILLFVALFIYAAIRLGWWLNALVYAETGPIQCFKLSFERSSGQVGVLILAYLISIAVTIAGLFLGCCPGLFIGLLVTLPFAYALSAVALMYGFLHRSGEIPQALGPR